MKKNRTYFEIGYERKTAHIIKIVHERKNCSFFRIGYV
ncbi:hypothetical protein B4064_2236 [Caldibacillus thermoamylovorans]|nr:hypothetical protein B4064_2236 [Caldibacillus thermoamylovorans]